MSCKVNLTEYPVNLHDDSMGSINSCYKNPNVFLTHAMPGGGAPNPVDGKYPRVSDKNIRIDTQYYMVANIANIAGRNVIVTGLQFSACNGMMVGGSTDKNVIDGAPGNILTEGGQLLSSQPISFVETGHNCLEALITDWRPVQGFKDAPGQEIPEHQTQQDRNSFTKSALYAQYNVTVHKITKKQKNVELAFQTSPDISSLRVVRLEDDHVAEIMTFAEIAEKHPSFKFLLEGGVEYTIHAHEINDKIIDLDVSGKKITLTVEAGGAHAEGTSAAYAITNAEGTEGFAIVIDYEEA